MFFYLLRLYDLDRIEDVLLFDKLFDLFFTLFTFYLDSSLYEEELLELELEDDEDEEDSENDIETD